MHHAAASVLFTDAMFFLMKRSRRSAANNPKKPVSSITRQVEYVPPADYEVRQYVRLLCEELAKVNPVYDEFEVRDGLMRFLTLLGEMTAKQMNATGSDTSDASHKANPT